MLYSNQMTTNQTVIVHSINLLILIVLIACQYKMFTDLYFNKRIKSYMKWCWTIVMLFLFPLGMLIYYLTDYSKKKGKLVI
ncbi:MAG: hypothetical protein JWO35_877 [Candidatus Saccharibacteria bacterium]|nr:hypothetical protein [Candidatus Saccharibacteria bacterium]